MVTSIEKKSSDEISELVKSSNLEHIAIIMDGNRRWAKSKFLPTAAGHTQGVKALKDTVKNCKKLGIDYDKLGKAEELSAWNVKDFHFLNEFLSPETQKIISDYKFLGDYARTSPCEFVAEVGSIIANGIKPPEKIMELYYKYGGPQINMELIK